MPKSIGVFKSARLIVEKLLAVKAGEQVAIVCDPHTEMRMAYGLAGAVESAGAEFTILMMPTRDKSRSNELTRVIEKGLEAADCMIGLTGACGAPTYSGAVKQLYKRRSLRAISMVFRSLEHFTEGGALADYDALWEDGLRLKSIWESGQTMRITTPAGTDLRAPIASDEVIVECGFATEPGQEAAFSDGEVSSRPLEGTAEGVIAADGPICYLGVPDEPIRIQVEKGKVTAAEGNSRQAEQLRRILRRIENADNIAEFGVGLNPMSRRNGDFEEEKKARGLVHVALGDNLFYGGSTRCAVHMDMVLYSPTVYMDDRVIVESGEMRLDAAQDGSASPVRREEENVGSPDGGNRRTAASARSN